MEPGGVAPPCGDNWLRTHVELFAAPKLPETPPAKLNFGHVALNIFPQREPMPKNGTKKIPEEQDASQPGENQNRVPGQA